jgi:carbonic anhydrase
MPRITGGGLNGTYIFHQLHLHWGSEHYKSGTQFPLEAQLIHFNEIYGSMENATDAPDGIAVLVTLFQV